VYQDEILSVQGDPLEWIRFPNGKGMTMGIESGKKAAAYPTKNFFVKMITRDIALEDSILDLIDNSIDGAWKKEGSRPSGLAEGPDLSHYHVRIEASPLKFTITDNCGGMSLEDAVEYAFSFGRRETDALDDYSIGVYGIGMKRAIFKLGASIKISSTYTDGNARTSFQVPIEVAEWLENDSPPWDFDIAPSEELAEDGVHISVEKLTSGAASAFGNPSFLQELKRAIARDYTLHLTNGIQIFLNGERIQGWPIELREGGEFKPIRVEYEDKVDGEPVRVELLAGMAAPPPDSSEPDGDGEIGRRSGWYVVCNGRIVLAADKTAVSGWGTDDWPQWHRQYDGFLGLILFSSKKATALPLTTTKRSVDVASEVYRRARPRMREVSKRWISYTGQRKQDLDQAKELESKTTPVSVQKVSASAEVVLPRLIMKTSERMANVSYSVPLAKLRGLAAEFGSINMNYKDVGLRSFQYAYDDLVEGE
jgi:hypothetical protein